MNVIAQCKHCFKYFILDDLFFGEIIEVDSSLLSVNDIRHVYHLSNCSEHKIIPLWKQLMISRNKK